MRNRFDQFGKDLATSTLGPLGQVDVQLALNAETLFADVRHEPRPGHEEDRQRLGLLGVLTSRPCLLELYSQSPSVNDLRTCITKHVVYDEQRLRDAPVERTGRRQHGLASREHDTWLLSAGVPETLLRTFAFEPFSNQPGVYRLAGDVAHLGVSIGLVVASELAIDRSTLLVRLMTGGRPLVRAMEELAALPPQAFERVTVEPILLRFHHALNLDPKQRLEPSEKEFNMAISKTWEQWRKQGQEEGRQEGRQEALKRLVIVKFGAIPSELEKRIAAASVAELDR